MINKARLRKKLKQARLAIDTKDLRNISDIICETTFHAMLWDTVRSIHYYVPITQNNEVDCLPLIKKLSSERPSIIRATWAKYNSFSSVEMNNEKRNLLPADMKFDLIIVPMLGFDATRHRLGYGGGHYDKFLALQPNAIKVGLCYTFGQVNSLPVEDHDIPMDIIITEKGIIK